MTKPNAVKRPHLGHFLLHVSSIGMAIRLYDREPIGMSLLMLCNAIEAWHEISAMGGPK